MMGLLAAGLGKRAGVGPTQGSVEQRQLCGSTALVSACPTGKNFLCFVLA